MLNAETRVSEAYPGSAKAHPLWRDRSGNCRLLVTVGYKLHHSDPQPAVLQVLWLWGEYADSMKHYKAAAAHQGQDS